MKFDQGWRRVNVVVVNGRAKKINHDRVIAAVSQVYWRLHQVSSPYRETEITSIGIIFVLFWKQKESERVVEVEQRTRACTYPITIDVKQAWDTLVGSAVLPPVFFPAMKPRNRVTPMRSRDTITYSFSIGASFDSYFSDVSKGEI